jgi:hypothetical protein
MKASLAPVSILLVALAACSSPSAVDGTARGDGASLSQREIAEAEAVARRVAGEQDATVTSASVTARAGTVEDSNTGQPCTSGRELRILLIGDFPHIETTGHPVPPGSPTPDFTVRAMTITADAESGLACLIGLRTGEDGPVQPPVGATPLSVGPRGPAS